MGVHAELPLHYTLTAPALPTAPRLCRDFVRAVLTASGLDLLAETAAMCTSELVTNVHRHGKGDVRLAATIERTWVRVTVHDDGPALPSPRRAASDEPNGRGLFLVTALSDVVGLTIDEPSEGTGKAVWFELNIPPESAA